MKMVVKKEVTFTLTMNEEEATTLESIMIVASKFYAMHDRDNDRKKEYKLMTEFQNVIRLHYGRDLNDDKTDH